jgi:hypothetical protein
VFRLFCVKDLSAFPRCLCVGICEVANTPSYVSTLSAQTHAWTIVESNFLWPDICSCGSGYGPVSCYPPYSHWVAWYHAICPPEIKSERTIKGFYSFSSEVRRKERITLNLRKHETHISNFITSDMPISSSVIFLPHILHLKPSPLFSPLFYNNPSFNF